MIIKVALALSLYFLLAIVFVAAIIPLGILAFIGLKQPLVFFGNKVVNPLEHKFVNWSLNH